MELPGAEKALQEAGFSAQASRFVALVVLSGGVFVREFASRWIGDTDARRARTERFIDGEVSAVWRRAFGRDKGLVNQRVRSGVVYHCSGRALYRALGAENSRYRRPLDPADWPRIVERVLKAWAALASPGWPWLFSIEAQVALADSLGVPRSALPRRSYGVVQKQDVCFPDRPLIACAGDRLVLVRPHVDDDPVDPAAALRTWWRNYSPFVEAVGAAGVSVSLLSALGGAAGRTPRAPTSAFVISLLCATSSSRCGRVGGRRPEAGRRHLFTAGGAPPRGRPPAGRRRLRRPVSERAPLRPRGPKKGAKMCGRTQRRPCLAGAASRRTRPICGRAGGRPETW